MKKTGVKVLAGVLCVSLAATGIVVGTNCKGSLKLCANDIAPDAEVNAEEYRAKKVAAADMNMALRSAGLSSDTIYVIADAEGNTQKVIYDDMSEKSEAELPIEVKAVYTLDGATTDVESLQGKSGHVVIRYELTNNAYEMKDVNGEQRKVYVPYLAAVGMVLDGEKFDNVSISHGKIIDDGDKYAVMGYALPGLQASLDIDSEKLDIPEYIEIEADTTDFDLETAYMIVSNEIFKNVDTDKIEENVDTKGLSDSLDELTDAMDKLMDGSRQLTEGFDELYKGAGEIGDGVDQLAAGLVQLKSNNAALNAGSAQVFDSILATANDQIKAAGLEVPELTKENYAQVIEGAKAGLSEDMVKAAAAQQVEAAVRANEDKIRMGVSMAIEKQVGPEAMATEQVKAMVEQKTEEQIQALIEENMASEEVQAQIEAGLAKVAAGKESLTVLKAQLDSYNQFYQGLRSYTAGVAQAADGAETLNENYPKLLEGITELKEGSEALGDGLREFNEKGIQKIVDAVNGDIKGLAESVKAVADSAKDCNDTANYIYKIDSIR